MNPSNRTPKTRRFYQEQSAENDDENVIIEVLYDDEQEDRSYRVIRKNESDSSSSNVSKAPKLEKSTAHGSNIVEKKHKKPVTSASDNAAIKASSSKTSMPSASKESHTTNTKKNSGTSSVLRENPTTHKWGKRRRVVAEGSSESENESMSKQTWPKKSKESERSRRKEKEPSSTRREDSREHSKRTSDSRAQREPDTRARHKNAAAEKHTHSSRSTANERRKEKQATPPEIQTQKLSARHDPVIITAVRESDYLKSSSRDKNRSTSADRSKTSTEANLQVPTITKARASARSKSPVEHHRPRAHFESLEENSADEEEEEDDSDSDDLEIIGQVDRRPPKRPRGQKRRDKGRSSKRRMRNAVALDGDNSDDQSFNVRIRPPRRRVVSEEATDQSRHGGRITRSISGTASPDRIRGNESGKPAISWRTRGSTSSILMKDGKPIPVFIQFKIPNRTQLASDVKSMSGEDLLLFPTQDSLNFTDLDHVEELRSTIRLNQFRFYNVALIDESRQVGHLLNPEPYLLYNPDTDKILPKPRDVYDGGVLDQGDNEEEDGREEEEKKDDDDDMEVLESAPIAKTRGKELPLDAKIKLAAAFQYKASSSQQPFFEVGSPRRRKDGPDVPFMVDDEEQRPKVNSNRGSAIDANIARASEASVRTSGAATSSKQEKFRGNDEDDGFDEALEPTEPTTSQSVSTGVRTTTEILIPSFKVNAPVAMLPTPNGHVVAGGQPFTLKEDLTIVEALTDPRITQAYGGTLELAVQVLAEKVFGWRRTFDSVSSRWKKKLSTSAASVRNMAAARNIKAFDLGTFFEELEHARDEERKKWANASTDARKAVHRTRGFTVEEDRKLLKYLLESVGSKAGSKQTYKDFAATHPWRSEESWRARWNKVLRGVVEAYKKDKSATAAARYKELLDAYPVGVRVLRTEGAVSRNDKGSTKKMGVGMDEDEIKSMFRDDYRGEGRERSRVKSNGRDAEYGRGVRIVYENGKGLGGGDEEREEESGEEDSGYSSSGTEVARDRSMELGGDGEEEEQTIRFPFSRGPHVVPVHLLSQKSVTDSGVGSRPGTGSGTGSVEGGESRGSQISAAG